METYRFRYGPQLVAGLGASAQLGELLPPGRCLFVTDANVRALGLADAALAGLPDVAVFDAVEQDPSRDTLLAAVAAGEGCASVVGFGGGSPMDVAKLAAYLLGSGDALDAIWGVGKALGARLLTEAEAAARARGRAGLWLNVWQKAPQAIAFYRRQGFDIVGTNDFHVGDDPQLDWVMAKRFDVA